MAGLTAISQSKLKKSHDVSQVNKTQFKESLLLKGSLLYSISSNCFVCLCVDV